MEVEFFNKKHDDEMACVPVKWGRDLSLFSEPALGFNRQELNSTYPLRNKQKSVKGEQVEMWRVIIRIY